MERVMMLDTDVLIAGPEIKSDIETRVLRSRLVNLTLDWELRSLSMDAQRYKLLDQTERESLRDIADTYRKCVAELSEALARCHSPCCKGEKS
jgi:hypothetical protein